MKKPNKQNTIIIILAILLVLAVGYISISKYIEVKQREQLSIYEYGMQQGYEQAILQLMQQASTCQQVPVFAGNQTMNLVAVECLQQEQR